MKIRRPTLLLDEKKCKANISRMAEKASRNKIIFRPHFKTHQSLEIGRWFKEVGVNQITVSSLEMAIFFSKEWDNITVAFPMNHNEIDAINMLAGTIHLNVLIESLDSVEFLKKHLHQPIGFFIKIDIGYHRTGIQPQATDEINSILAASKENDNLIFQGFLAHAGQTYKCRGPQEIQHIHNQSIQLFTQLKNKFKPEYPNLLLSVGDTPSCSTIEDFTAFDEIRPGNFVFYDLSQQQIGSCTFDQIAVAMACPIVAIHKERNEIIIYGGGVHFSKDSMQDDHHGTIYGKVVQGTTAPWSDIIPNMFVRSLSQEHGIVTVPAEFIANYKIGDHLLIVPVHSCMTADLMKRYNQPFHYTGNAYFTRQGVTIAPVLN